MLLYLAPARSPHTGLLAPYGASPYGQDQRLSGKVICVTYDGFDLLGGHRNAIRNAVPSGRATSETAITTTIAFPSLQGAVATLSHPA